MPLGRSARHHRMVRKAEPIPLLVGKKMDAANYSCCVSGISCVNSPGLWPVGTIQRIRTHRNQPPFTCMGNRKQCPVTCCRTVGVLRHRTNPGLAQGHIAAHCRHSNSRRCGNPSLEMGTNLVQHCLPSGNYPRVREPLFRLSVPNRRLRLHQLPTLRATLQGFMYKFERESD